MTRSVIVPVLFVAAIWGSAFPMIKIGLEGLSAPHLTLLRHLVASLALLLFLGVMRARLRPRRADLGRFLLLGGIGYFVYHLALNYGELQVSAGAASLIIATAPAMTAVVAALLAGDRLPPVGWLGSGISFAGVALIVLGDSGVSGISFSSGAWYVLIAAVAAAFFSVLQKPLFARYRPVEVTAFATWAGTVPMLAFLPGFATALANAGGGPIWSAVYNGVFPSAVAYTLFALALSRAPVTLVTAFLYLVPVFGLGTSWLLLGEVPTLLMAIGGAVAIFGIVVVNRAKQLEARRRAAAS